VRNGLAGRIRVTTGGPHPAWRLRLSPWLAAAAVALVLPLEAALAATTLYKWTDEQGVVHYTDKIPPEVVNRGSVELSKQGMPGKKTDPLGTPEQQQARAAEAARQRALAKEREDVARQDRAVLDSYTTESDIDLARNRALKTIDSALQSAQSYTAQLTKRKAALAEMKIEPTDKSGLAARERELSRIDTDIAAQTALITQKQKEIVATNTKYDEDKARWHAALVRKQYIDGPPPTVANGAAAATPAAKTTKK
jgi:hypothetical protein